MNLTRRDLHLLAAGAIAGFGVVTDPKGALAQTGNSRATTSGENTDPLGGQPAAGSKPSVADFAYQIKYQRAFEAVLWSLPAVVMYRCRAAAISDLGVRDNDIISYSRPATPKLETLTANSTAPYVAACTDLQKGPAVLEIPPSGPDGSLYGQVVDAWQFTIADVGPSGLDGGKGGKLLFTPPGYSGTIPDGYIHVPSPNYRIAFAFRSVPGQGKTTEDAHQYAKKLRIYYLADAENPPEQRFVDPIDERYATLPFYDERYFSDLYDIVSVEPVKPQDKVMMGMLLSLGIERGKPYSPDETTQRALRQAAVDAWFFLQDWYDNFPSGLLFWPDRHYASLLQTDANKTFTFEYDDRIDLISRAAQYFWCTYVPKILSDTPANWYLAAMADKAGQPLVAGKLYKIDVPVEMPVSQFWALTVYDRATLSFIYSESNRTTLSSYDLSNMTRNSEGGVTIYVGPTAPDGLESNWIPTSGKRPMPTFRYYGATDALHTKSFKMPDFELVG